MSVLFCHDHRFLVGPDGAVYSRGQYSQAIVARYERVFGQMCIAARTMPTPDPFDSSRLNLVFDDSSRLVPMPDLSSPRALLIGDAAARGRLTDAMDGAGVVVVRLPSEVGLLARRVARQRRKPLITEVVACARDGLLSHGGITARAYAPFAAARMHRAVARSGWTLYVTERFLQNRYPSAGEQVSVSNVQLPPPDETTLPRRLERIKASDRRLTFGMVAAIFHDEKRVDVAIRGLASAREMGADCRLDVVGPGDPRSLLALAEELGVADRVAFIGPLPHGDELFAFLDGVDAYIQTSFQEGLPRALIEAMSRALPALASDAGGTNELLTSNWLHDPGDFRVLAEQMVALQDPAVRVRLAEENFARAADFTSSQLDARRASFWVRFCVAHGIASQLQDAV